MALPCGTTGSLCSGFPPARHVCLPVKRPFAIALCRRLPIGVRAPLGASVTLLEATTPVKLPAKRCLFVPSRVIGIITDTTISLGSWLRQCPDHYTIRARRNLPDKEFRYLRTVIVTAAVYWGFNSTLRLAADISS